MNTYQFLNNNFYPILGAVTLLVFVIMEVKMLKKEYRVKAEAINEIFKR